MYNNSIKHRWRAFATQLAVTAVLSISAAATAAESFSDPESGEVSSNQPPKLPAQQPFEPEMVIIPAGSFFMGSTVAEQRLVSRTAEIANENPRHQVTIDKAFEIGKYEVTFDEWDACVDDGGCIAPKDNGWGFGRRPVINISWKDIKQYIKWLSDKTGKSYRLSSEAEWEYAARAGTTTMYWWGNDIGKNRANCNGCGSQWDNKRTAPVGSFAANPWGLYDMNGNVSEWVEDCPHDNYHGAPTDGSAWGRDEDCHLEEKRTMRGGSWSSNPRALRSAQREFSDIYNKRTGCHRSGELGLSTCYDVNQLSSDSFGFRVARTLTP